MLQLTVFRQKLATENTPARVASPQAVGMPFGIANSKFQIENLRSAICHSQRGRGAAFKALPYCPWRKDSSPKRVRKMSISTLLYRLEIEERLVNIEKHHLRSLHNDAFVSLQLSSPFAAGPGPGFPVAWLPSFLVLRFHVLIRC